MLDSGSPGDADQTKKKVCTVVVDDESQYSQAFLEDLKARKYPAQIRLAGDKIIVDGETTTFPDDLALNKDHAFSAMKDAESFRLKVTRISHTTIRYEFKLSEGETVKFTSQGLADLNPMFFLAAEVARDEEKADAILGHEYTREDGGCRFTVMIGLGRDSHGKLRAILKPAACNMKNSRLGAAHKTSVTRYTFTL